MSGVERLRRSSERRSSERRSSEHLIEILSVTEIASSRCALLAMTAVVFRSHHPRHCERSEAISPLALNQRSSWPSSGSFRQNASGETPSFPFLPLPLAG